MADRHSQPHPPLGLGLGQPNSLAEARPPRDSGEAILLSLASVLGLLWAIVLVTHFHGTLSGFGQSLWLMR